MSSVSLGTLVAIDWKAGVSLASSATRSLNWPFVALQLTLRSPDGSLASRHLRLSMPEFSALLAGLQDAHRAMAKLS